MRARSIFKPVKSNTIGSIVLFLFLPVIPILCIVYDGPDRIQYFSIISIIKINIVNKNFDIYPNVPSIVPLSALVISYLFVTMAKAVWDNSRLHKIYNVLKPCRSKIIISLIGFSTIPYFIIDYITGIYGGTSNLPDTLYSLRQSFDFYFEIAVLPFSLFSYFFFRLNVFCINLFLIFTRVGNLSCELPSDLAHEGILAAIIVIGAIVIDWYIFAGIIVEIFKKIKRKMRIGSPNFDNNGGTSR